MAWSVSDKIYGDNQRKRNSKRTAGFSTNSDSVTQYFGTKSDNNKNTKECCSSGNQANKGAQSGKKWSGFKKSKGLLDYKGVSQYGGSNNNENPFQIN